MSVPTAFIGFLCLKTGEVIPPGSVVYDRDLFKPMTLDRDGQRQTAPWEWFDIFVQPRIPAKKEK